jgi:putative oxidoreductase
MMPFPLTAHYSDSGLFLLRLALGVVFIAHGLPKIKDPAGFAKGVNLPLAMGWVVAIVEFVGGIAVLLGIAVQVVSSLIAINMIGALYYHIAVWKHPFKSSNGQSWELAFVMLCIVLTLMSFGGGRYGMMMMY